MTPNTRKRKSRLAEELTEFLQEWNLDGKEDTLDVVLLTLKQLGLSEKLDAKINDTATTETRGRKMTPFSTRKVIWNFFHEEATPSTITSRPAKLRVSERGNIQTGLDFAGTTTIVNQRGKQFYENNWMMLHTTYHELYLKFIEKFPNHKVSHGTFFALKPFYIRTETEKDIEMCCCKHHLHARWSIESIVKSAKEHNLGIPFEDYASFFAYLYSDCDDSETAYIPWSCTPNKNEFCTNIKHKWENLIGRLKESSNEKILIDFTTFEMVKYVNKKGKEVEHLKAVTKMSSLAEIVTFLDKHLSNFIHHRNHLRHYRNISNSFREYFDVLFLDIDFSENLKIPVKFEPQSMHWHHETVTVHSGITKIHGQKSYHPYISDDKKHDQKCVKYAVEEMLDSIHMIPEICIIESDNCNSQYKSAQHFDDMQSISNRLGIPLIRIFSIAGHGKGEVDHVGGLAKCALRRHVGTGGKISTASDCISFLQKKFSEKQCPNFVIKEIKVEKLEEMRAEARLKSYPTISGSDQWHVIVFHPHSTTLKASPQLCICDLCKECYGSCSLFKSYELRTCDLKGNHTRSGVESTSSNVEEEVIDDGLILPGSFCAIAADHSSLETIWFVKINDYITADVDVTDDYGVQIAAGQSYIEGHFLEKVSSSNKGHIYKLQEKKKTFFFRESVVYPFVQILPSKRGHFLSINEYVEILNFIESNGLSHI